MGSWRVGGRDVLSSGFQELFEDGLRCVVLLVRLLAGDPAGESVSETLPNDFASSEAAWDSRSSGVCLLLDMRGAGDCGDLFFCFA